VGPLAIDFGPLYRELARRGNPPWAGVEANAGFPGSAVGWEGYLARHYNHGAVLVGVNTGATGTDLPRRLEKSAFGDEALAAYRKFLSGETLEERDIAADHPRIRLQRKMQRVQQGIRRWQRERRDPRPVGEILEQLEPLIRQGKIKEAEAVLDRALELLEK
jgi:hypothetical protein